MGYPEKPQKKYVDLESKGLSEVDLENKGVNAFQAFSVQRSAFSVQRSSDQKAGFHTSAVGFLA